MVYLAYTSIYVARINLSMAGPELILGGVLDTVQLGLLGSVFSTVFASGRLINGGLSDKTPPWVMLTSGLALAGLSNLFVSFFPPFIGIFILWTANAYAQSMLWSSVLCVVSSMYEKSVAKQKTSVMVTSVAMGNILGIIINTSILSIYPMHYLKTGNVASVSGMMDFATYLGGGVASMVYGVVIKNFGYLPMFVSWIVLSLASMLVIYKIAKNRKRQIV